MPEYSTAILEQVQQQQSTMVINGIPQDGQTVTVYLAKCKACNRILAQFNPGDSISNVIQYCKHKLAQDFIYCPTCGRKLNYSMDIIDVKETPDAS